MAESTPDFMALENPSRLRVVCVFFPKAESRNERTKRPCPDPDALRRHYKHPGGGWSHAPAGNPVKVVARVALLAWCFSAIHVLLLVADLPRSRAGLRGLLMDFVPAVGLIATAKPIDCPSRLFTSLGGCNGNLLFGWQKKASSVVNIIASSVAGRSLGSLSQA